MSNWPPKVGSWEDDALLPELERAKRRLAAAVKAERSSSHLPPSCAGRQKVIEELHWAEAFAAEMTA